MAKIVGLSRNLKLQWLNKVVELTLDGLNKNDIKKELNDFLSFEITSPTNIRKTREILMNIWVYENQCSERLRERALFLIQSYPQCALEIHWCMMLSAYPVFIDMSKLIGKMAEFQDQITLSQIRTKLFDELGERTTLLHSIDKLISTFKNLEVLTTEKPGKYFIKKQNVKNSEVVLFMVYTLMCLDDSGYYSFDELNSSTYFFPFEYHIKKESILEDERFTINNFGGELSIGIRL